MNRNQQGLIEHLQEESMFSKKCWARNRGSMLANADVWPTQQL